MEELEIVERFRFECSPKLSCFNTCCTNLSIALTPYDVLMLSRGLETTTGEFLRKYTTWHIGIATGMPVVTFKEDNCPFVSREGCRVYSHRPTACRLYPLARVKVGDEEFYFLIREDFCLGHGGKEWSVEEWLEDQGVKNYNRMNDVFFELVALKPKLSKELAERIVKIVFDIDGFKKEMEIEDDEEALKVSVKVAAELMREEGAV